HWHFLDNQFGDAPIPIETVPEVEHGITFEHKPKTLGEGLVEPIELFDAGDQFRVQSLGTPVLKIRAALHLGFYLPAAESALDLGAHTLELGQGLLNGAAGGGLNDQEVDQHDSEQGRNDQQQTA